MFIFLRRLPTIGIMRIFLQETTFLLQSVVTMNSIWKLYLQILPEDCMYQGFITSFSPASTASTGLLQGEGRMMISMDLGPSAAIYAIVCQMNHILMHLVIMRNVSHCKTFIVYLGTTVIVHTGTSRILYEI